MRPFTWGRALGQVQRGTEVAEVIVQSAQDFTVAPVARIKLNHRVPLGFHGNWIPAAAIEASLLRAGR